MWSGTAPLSATRSTRVPRLIVWMVFALAWLRGWIAPALDVFAISVGGEVGGLVGVGEDVEHAADLKYVEQALDDALRSGQDNGRVRFGPERGDGAKQDAEAGAIQEGGGGEVDHEVAMAVADLAGYRVFQARCEREVELPGHVHE